MNKEEKSRGYKWDGTIFWDELNELWEKEFKRNRFKRWFRKLLKDLQEAIKNYRG